jgi:hypothetical protein
VFINYLDLESYGDAEYSELCLTYPCPHCNREIEQKILDEWNAPLRTDN